MLDGIPPETTGFCLGGRECQSSHLVSSKLGFGGEGLGLDSHQRNIAVCISSSMEREALHICRRFSSPMQPHEGDPSAAQIV
jgi:hypothetical protein